MSWRAVVKTTVGLGIGAICLVAWSSTSSAAEPAPPPPGPLTTLTDQLLPPVEQVTDPLGLGPVVDPALDGLVGPTVVTLDGTLAALGSTVVELPPLLGQPSGPVLPGPGLPQVPALPRPGPGTSHPFDPAGAASVPTGAGVAESAVTAPAGAPSSTAAPSTDRLATVAAGRADHGATAASSSITAAPADDGAASPSSLPVLPAVLGVGGTALLSATGAGSVGPALVAVLAGVAVMAVAPVWRRLAARGLLAPPAMTYAIATPPG
jgi:hypothetical protein